MPYKGPHISIDMEFLVDRVLHIGHDEFAEWPEAVRELSKEIAAELFLVSYNPFIDASLVRESVRVNFDQARMALSQHYASAIEEGITNYWNAYTEDMNFREEIIHRLQIELPHDRLDLRPQARVESSTDATDLRMHLPLLVIVPTSAEEVSTVVKLANEMNFALIPSGGASGLTGGAIPASNRSVVMSLTRLNTIKEINEQEKTITLEAGVITNDAIKAAEQKGLLFSVDPASKTASTIGGNIAENSGGPLCFEYGTTIDNILSFRMVTPTGEIIDIVRMNHPRHKIMEQECAVFEVRDISGGVRKVVSLFGNELRGPGLGKDVTNKALGGLPGLQKEGVDGIITEASFILHDMHQHKRVMVLEFFGRSLVHAMKVIKEVVHLRDKGRVSGDLVKITALEEFGNKYVQAIEYKKKSSSHEGDPISVLILQLESDNEDALSDTVNQIAQICSGYDQVEAFTAKDAREEEVFWEDRHRLSAIAKRTSGFKINEDVVIPIDAVPEFAVFIEQLNLECTARAYRSALQAIGRIQDFPEEENDVSREFVAVTRIIKGEVPASDMSDQELELRAVLFLKALRERHPAIASRIAAIEAYMLESRIMVANHMHAGDGNCHVNIPVNSSDVDMLHNAEKTAIRVMKKAQDIGGAVSGEHGIGITKIAFLSQAKMEAICEVKRMCDPRNIMNPTKLVQKTLPVQPFTFSFNRLIKDIGQSGIEDKERLISLLADVQRCTRCGKCKLVCPMYSPEARLFYQPRNKNMTLGSLIEAIYYTRINRGVTDPGLMRELRTIMEHCTACGKCTSVCPVKIKSADVALTSRAIVEKEKQGGHPIKSRVLNYLAADVGHRVPKMAKMASTGQRMSNRFLGIIPASLRKQISNPLFAGPGPRIGYRHLSEVAKLDKGGLFVPHGEVKGTVLYFPGCAGSMFYRSIALGGILLLLRAGYAVMLPQEQLCCGIPLLAAGLHTAYTKTSQRTIAVIKTMAELCSDQGYPASHLLTACGSCLDGLERLLPAGGLMPPSQEKRLPLQDMLQFLHENQSFFPGLEGKKLLYHSSCHAEWAAVSKQKASRYYAEALSECTQAIFTISPGCCGESGMGAMTSPMIYNKIRNKKIDKLKIELPLVSESTPILVSCPSCKMGIGRALLQLGEKRPVLHSLEYLAEACSGSEWRKKFPKLLAQSAKAAKGGPRVINLAELGSVTLTPQDDDEDDA